MAVFLFCCIFCSCCCVGVFLIEFPIRGNSCSVRSLVFENDYYLLRAHTPTVCRVVTKCPPQVRSGQATGVRLLSLCTPFCDPNKMTQQHLLWFMSCHAVFIANLLMFFFRLVSLPRCINKYRIGRHLRNKWKFCTKLYLLRMWHYADMIFMQI